MMASDIENPRRSTEQKVVTVHLKRRVLVVLWILVVVPWVVGGALWFQMRPRQTKEISPFSPLGASTNNMGRCRPGPWGDLEYVGFMLEPPDEYVNLRDAVGGPFRWLFKGQSREQAGQQMEKAGLTAQQRASGTWEETPLGAVFKPDEAVVSDLSAEVRGPLYEYLGQFEENEAQANPYRFRGDDLEDWFRDSELQPETVELVCSYLYRRGTSLAFADGNIVFPKLTDDAERARLLKVLSRRAALQVRLRVTKNSNLEELTNYWSIGGRSKDIGPMFASLARELGGGRVDVLHLLPRFARIFLNTYPPPLSSSMEKKLNCHWTSLNFFRLDFDDNLATVEGATKAFQEGYYEIVGPPRLGDVLFFSLPSGEGIHSCVYIADDIVFTKNGTSLSAPWLLMSLSDAMAYYTSSMEVKVRTFRPKERVG